MRGKRLSIGLRMALAMFAVALFATSTWATERKLHNFGKGTDGAVPSSSLIFDAAGNLYGTTGGGGAYGWGTVFELTPKEGGGWTEKVLHNFNYISGGSPFANLIFDAAGNLYGTTYYGGPDYPCGVYYGCGTVFELTPKEDGSWTEKVLHNFGKGKDGFGPSAGLIFDAAGNLYGTTNWGGDNPCYGLGCGTVFELTPREDGRWTEKVLHNFGKGKDGFYPQAGLIFDAAGNLYGTTHQGGDYTCYLFGCGTVFELTPQEGGGWTEKKLHNFGKGMDGALPYASLIFDAAGNLYGTTVGGGDYPCGGAGCGTVFELMPEEGGGWTEKKLHNFGDTKDGTGPYAGLIFDAAGNLYGTTVGGGDYPCNNEEFPGCGTVFELTPREGGSWTEKKLHNFGNTDGAEPSSGLIFDAAGNLYGATGQGGDYQYGGVGLGTVFEIIP